MKMPCILTPLLVLSSLSLVAQEVPSAQTAMPETSALAVYGDLWRANIDYKIDRQDEDGDSTMWGQGLRGDLGAGLRGDLFFAIGYEDYGTGHTDVYHLRGEVSKPLGFAELGLGWTYWNNGYSTGGSNEETGPTLSLDLSSQPFTKADFVFGLDLLWCPVDIGDDADYEFLLINPAISKSFSRVDASIGHRTKYYYESPNDYIYHGFFLQVGVPF